MVRCSGMLQRDKVKKVIYLASPLLGTPTIANVWYNEDISFVGSTTFDDLGVSVEDFTGVYKLITGMMDPIQNLICNYVSIYELFPSKYYFQITESSYISNSYTLVAIGGTNTVTECSTYTATKEILTGYFDDFDSDLMALAEAFHDTTFISGNHVSAYVDASYWSCYTDSLDDATISHLKFYDYHFGYRTDSGEWVNKHGYNSYSQRLGTDLPTNDNSKGWDCNVAQYYNSNLVYYRITE